MYINSQKETLARRFSFDRCSVFVINCCVFTNRYI